MQRQIVPQAGSAALGNAICPGAGLFQHCDAPPSGLGHEKAHEVILVSWSFAFRKDRTGRGSKLEQNASLQRHFGLGTTGRVGDSVAHSKDRLRSPYHRCAGEVKHTAIEKSPRILWMKSHSLSLSLLTQGPLCGQIRINAGVNAPPGPAYARFRADSLSLVLLTPHALSPNPS